MRLAAVAVHLGPFHEKAPVDAFADHFWIDRLVEAGPACAAVEFMGLVKDGCSAADTHVGAGVFGEILVAAGALCPVFARDLIGQIRELLAPFGVGFDDFVHRGYPFVMLPGNVGCGRGFAKVMRDDNSVSERPVSGALCGVAG